MGCSKEYSRSLWSATLCGSTSGVLWQLCCNDESMHPSLSRPSRRLGLGKMNIIGIRPSVGFGALYGDTWHTNAGRWQGCTGGFPCDPRCTCNPGQVGNSGKRFCQVVLPGVFVRVGQARALVAAEEVHAGESQLAATPPHEGCTNYHLSNPHVYAVAVVTYGMQVRYYGYTKCCQAPD